MTPHSVRYSSSAPVPNTTSDVPGDNVCRLAQPSNRGAQYCARSSVRERRERIPSSQGEVDPPERPRHFAAATSAAVEPDKGRLRFRGGCDNRVVPGLPSDKRVSGAI